MSKLFRCALVFLVTVACVPNESSACWLPLPWHCGWSWNPFDPCGVFSSNCSNGHCGVRRAGLRTNVWAMRQQRVAARRTNIRANVLNRRTNRACARCSRLQRRQCSCGQLNSAAAMCATGFGTMAAGPVPMTTQVPITTYRNVTVDMGSYQKVWVPRIVTQRVPQTSYQSKTVWMNSPQQGCADGGCGSVAPLMSSPGPAALPLGSPYSSTPFGATQFGGTQYGGTPFTGVPSQSYSPIVPSSPMLPGSTMMGPGTIVPSPDPYMAAPTPGQSYDGVPYPPSAAANQSMRSASALGLSTGLYSDRVANYGSTYSAPSLPGLSIPSTTTYGSSTGGGSAVIDDRAITSGGFDDWVDVGPGQSATANTYEPQRYVQRSTTPASSAGTYTPKARSTSGMFSPVRPGTGIARARFTGR